MAAAIFLLPVYGDIWWEDNSTAEQLDLENIRIAVGILFLTAVKLEICLGVKYPQFTINVVRLPFTGQWLT